VVVTPVNGAAPRPVKRFLVGPIGAEICGPALTPDEHAFFCAIQHPGENDLKGKAIADLKTAGLGPGSHFPRGGGAWPLSSVVVVTRKDGKKVWA
jgi:secreted PhoX family phosphatase